MVRPTDTSTRIAIAVIEDVLKRFLLIEGRVSEKELSPTSRELHSQRNMVHNYPSIKLAKTLHRDTCLLHSRLDVWRANYSFS